MAIIWKRSKPRHPDFDVMLSEIEYRSRVASADEWASPRDLLDLRQCRLVRAVMTRTRGSRRRALALAVGVPLAVWAASLILRAQPQAGNLASWLVLGMVCFWPTVCFLGAAFSAAGTVVEERERDTAIQLVLTPIAKRDIVASVILPAVWPYIWGPVALLPLYIWAGGHPCIVAGWHPAVTMLWPARMLLPLAGVSDAGLSFPGALAGLLMGLTDAAFIWAAAHWGAIYALRVGSLAMTAGLLGGRTLLMALGVLGFGVVCGMAMNWGSGTVGGIAVALMPESGPTAGAVIAFLIFAALLAWTAWYVLLIMPLKAALREFTYFDWLAFDDYRPEPWRGWDFFRQYGDRV